MMAASSGSEDDDPVYREVTSRFWILRLVTEARVDGLYVRLEPLQRSFRRIPVDRIKEVHVETYSARAYGGWHWGLRRTPSGNTVYRLRGSRGVEVTLTDGTRWFIGSQHPSRLKSSLEWVSNSNAVDD